MISRQDVKVLIDDVESEYQICWDTLCKLKRKHSERLTAEEIVGFQARLARPLFDLNDTYRALCKERTETIGRKRSLSPKWFEQRLRLLHEYQEAIKTAIAVGKAIGDSFAWFFYRNRRERLLEHQKHQRIFHTPPGIGGKGELEFVERFRLVDGHLVIYHGTTTFLRIGDVSFVDTETLEPTATGELKTRRVAPGELEIGVFMFGRGDGKFARTVGRAVEHSDETVTIEAIGNGLPDHVRDRLSRQVPEILESLSSSNPDHSMELELDMPIRQLTELYEGLKTSQVTYKRAGDGLVLVGCLDGKRSLSSRLLNKSSLDWKDRLERSQEYALGIMRDDSRDNHLFISNLKNPRPDRGLTPGMSPLFWWPLPLEFVRQVIFQKALLFTLYNPAHLVAKLREAGFDIRPKKEHGSFRVTRRLKSGSVMAIENFGFFTALVVHELFPEEAVVQALVDVAEQAESQSIPDYTRIQLHIYQHLIR